MRPQRNATDYDIGEMNATGGARIFDPATIELDRGMGAIPAAVLAMTGHVRGNHPLNSFVAVGPLAAELVRGQKPLGVYEPLAALARLGGYVVLMGVGLTSMTLLHLAEQRAGRTLFRRWANGRDGKPMMVETGCCSNGFERFAPVLDSVERRGLVGNSVWRVFPAAPALDLATQAIRTDPEITRCGDSECRRCADAVLGGPIL
jgi:aminoglycoside 3-N-acetyltransferase